MCEPRSANLERAPRRARGDGGGGGRAPGGRPAPLRALPDRAPATAGRMTRIMEPIEPARATGWTSRSTSIRIPPAARSPSASCRATAQEGGPDAILTRLRDPGERRRIARLPRPPGRCHGGGDRSRTCPRSPELEGMSLADVGGAGRARHGGDALPSCCWSEELKIGHLGAPPREPGPLAAGRPGLHDAARAARLHGVQRHDAGRQLPAPALVRRLPALPRPAPPRVRRAHARGDGPADDRRARPPVRPHPAGPHRARLLRGPRRLRRASA